MSGLMIGLYVEVKFEWNQWNASLWLGYVPGQVARPERSHVQTVLGLNADDEEEALAIAMSVFADRLGKALGE